MTVRALLLVLALLAPASAEAAAACHRYSVWHYPTPQRCGAQIRANLRKPVSREKAAIQLPTAAPKISLPRLTRNDCKGGEADELTRARLELLGYAYAH